MKVLIICNDFPPLNSIGAQRPYSWFKYFHKAGIDVTLITKNWSGNSATPLDVVSNVSSENTIYNDTEQGLLIRVPIKPVLPERLLIKHGETKYQAIRRVLTLFYKMFSFFWFFFDKHCALYHEANDYLKKNKVDLIITTGEPFILFRYGYLLKKRFNTPWIADYRDGWFLNQDNLLLKSYVSRVLRYYELFFEKKFLKKANFITTVDAYLAGKLKNLLNKQVEVVYNGFEEFKEKKESKKQTDSLILTHTGNLKPGQRVEFLLDVVRNLHNKKKIFPGDLVINFTGLKYYQDQVDRILNYDICIANYVKFSDRLSREESLEINQSSDYLLVFTDSNYTAIYAKTYDYLAVGRPILVLPDDKGILGDLIRSSNAGNVIDDKKEVEEFLIKSINTNKAGKLENECCLNKEKISFYTRENQAYIFVEFIKKILKKRVLILAYDFPPNASIGAQRPNGWYKYFHENGLYPVVVTRKWPDKIENVLDTLKEVDGDDEFETSENGEIIKVAYYPNIRDRILLSKGENNWNFIRKALTFFYSFAQYFSFAFDNKSLIYYRASEYLKQWPCEAIIATGEPFVLFRYARMLSKENHTPWIADYRDGWSTNYTALHNIDWAGNLYMKGFIKHIEKHLVNTASVITTTADSQCSELLHLHEGKNVKLVMNGYFEEFFSGLEDISQNNKCFEIAYAGTIYPFQRLEVFLEGFSLFVKKFNYPSNIKIKFYGVAFYPENASRILNYDAFLNRYIEITQRLPQDEVLRKMKASNLLLLLANEKIGQVYAKVFDYVALKRKVLMVVNDHGNVSGILRDTNLGLLAENSDDVLKYLEQSYKEFLQTGVVAADSVDVDKYSRRVQAAKMATLIKELI